jgi:hypothetical protein
VGDGHIVLAACRACLESSVIYDAEQIGWFP